MTFPIGLTATSFDIVINDDEILENNETFIVCINSITNEHMVDTPGLTTITIVDTSSEIIINTTTAEIIINTEYCRNSILTYVNMGLSL